MLSHEHYLSEGLVCHYLIENADRIARVRDPKKRSVQCEEYARIILVPLAAHGIPVSLLERIKIDFVRPQRNSELDNINRESGILKTVRETIEQEFGQELSRRVSLVLSPEKHQS
ncbi:MAG: hypothetical protein HYV90_04960 [Candidatus Woesebacteria bacterium]|nr:MAG: hypothetical protein HYV90_04960 [Candidatus Woesebacteria bacterium]